MKRLKHNTVFALVRDIHVNAVNMHATKNTDQLLVLFC